MNAETADWGDGQFGLRLAIGPDEIDLLTENLRILRKDPDQHFHITSHVPRGHRLRDIEVSTLVAGQGHNMRLTSVALAPGTEVPDPVRTPRLIVAPVRLLAIWALWLFGTYAGGAAAFMAYATYATADYRPILIRGVWMSGVALNALHAATMLSKTWKGRIPAVIGALLVLSVLGELLRRLSAFR